jgi:cyclic pyranopterin phosphate synthase
MNHPNTLLDSFGRKHNYLRISLTPHCNLRCFYCMPNEDYDAPPAAALMQLHEIDQIVNQFVKLGVTKIRLTGGEPLIRKDAGDVIKNLAKYNLNLAITTNGIRLHDFLPVFTTANLRSINISLDTLDANKFEMITKRNQFNRVWDNIQLLIQQGLHVKLNMVVMKGINDNEILNFVAITKHQPIHVRFIEYMPFDGNNWNSSKVFGWQQILDLVAQEYDYYKLDGHVNDTAKNYQVFNHEGTFSVISTMTAPFCSTCNRMRLTADGKMKNCLFSKEEIDLLTPLRNGLDIEPLIRQCIWDKKEKTGGQFSGLVDTIDASAIHNRSMIAIGG